jgi:hypothetical protein
MLLLATSDFLPLSLQEVMKLLFSASSMAITAYFWLVRMNKEKVSLAFYGGNGFEGTLEPHGVGLWRGRIFLANRSVLPTAIVRVQVELWWEERWLTGVFHTAEGSELPWNLPPSQVFPKNIIAAFDLGPNTSCEQVYANQRLRFTFETVEGKYITGEAQTVLAAGQEAKAEEKSSSLRQAA